MTDHSQDKDSPKEPSKEPIEDPKLTLAGPLLSNEEFAAMMALDYKKAGRPESEIATYRGWQRLKTSLNLGKQGKPKWMIAISAVVAAGLVLVTLPSIQETKTTTDVAQRPKGIDNPVGDIEFHLFEHGKLGRRLPKDASIRAGQTVVLAVTGTVPLHWQVLLDTGDSQGMTLRPWQGVLQPGKPTLVGPETAVWSYDLQPSTQIKACVLFTPPNKDSKATAQAWRRGDIKMSDLRCTKVMTQTQ